MAAIVKFLFVVLFLGIVSQSKAMEVSPVDPYVRHDWECTPWDDIKLTTVATGLTVNGTKQWKATFFNDCRCAQLEILVDAEGFSTEEHIDPDVLDLSDPMAVLNAGSGGLDAYDSVSFTYTAEKPFIFKGITSDLDCPPLAPAPAPSV